MPEPPLPRASGADSLDDLLAEIRGCTRCAAHLPLGPRPVLQVGATARILIAAQAPGTKVHDSGRPFTDASGERLRTWLDMPLLVFYDPARVAIVPMGFCYPGRGAGGDLPPRPECALTWRAAVLAHLPQVALTLVIGRYAMDWHLPQGGASVGETVRRWREFWPSVLPLPHPSPRNNLWLRRHPWFEAELLPALRVRVADVLGLAAAADRRGS
ncbi:MAG: uracil-DNA glycosylase family protein [Burkholderiaceae bacterium]|nr:uracil-DNA glycosylase family protein [Aquabacterium sp.]NUP85103.1 uracil-DNA glycosylase family protein [Burkholderiaceae bacterium]